MDTFCNINEVLSVPWKVANQGDMCRIVGYKDLTPCEDISILTINGYEVVACSEWMRADREVFDHIVKIHNDSIGV